MAYTKLNDKATIALCQQYLTLVYQDIDMSSVKPIASIAQTSGEILYFSLDKLISTIRLSEQDVFVDLGSGSGKVVLYFFLRTPLQEARGIEILDATFQYSVQAAKRVKQELPEFFTNDRKLTFIHADFLKLSFNDATILFLCSVCFGQDMLCIIGEVINNTPSIHTVLTLRPITNISRLPFYTVVNVECSWGPALCYIYCKAPE